MYDSSRPVGITTQRQDPLLLRRILHAEGPNEENILTDWSLPDQYWCRLSFSYAVLQICIVLQADIKTIDPSICSMTEQSACQTSCERVIAHNWLQPTNRLFPKWLIQAWVRPAGASTHPRVPVIRSDQQREHWDGENENPMLSLKAIPEHWCVLSAASCTACSGASADSLNSKLSSKLLLLKYIKCRDWTS